MRSHQGAFRKKAPRVHGQVSSFFFSFSLFFSLLRLGRAVARVTIVQRGEDLESDRSKHRGVPLFLPSFPFFPFRPQRRLVVEINGMKKKGSGKRLQFSVQHNLGPPFP